MTTDAFFGEVRSLVHSLEAHPQRIDHALWCLLTNQDETKPWREYLREGLGQIRMGRVSMLECVDWLSAGRGALREKIGELQEEVPEANRLSEEDLDVFLCVMAWSLTRSSREVMMARPGFFVFFQRGEVTFSSANGNYVPGIMGDVHEWPGFDAWVAPPEEMSRALRDANEQK